MNFLFAEDASAARLVEALRRRRFWGEIVGPHGSGKSTLLCTLSPRLAAEGRRLYRYDLKAGDHRWPGPAAERRCWNSESLVIVDGFEQLGLLGRWWLMWSCRRRGCGLLVTSHKSVGMPELITLAPQLATVAAVAARLLNGDEAIGLEDIENAFAGSGGNVRETLFSLYDLYEERRRR